MIEDIGIERSKANAEKADLIIHLESLMEDNSDESFDWLNPYQNKIIGVYNKADEWMAEILREGLLIETQDHSKLYISAKKGKGIAELKERLFEKVNRGQINAENTIVTNARHHDALLKVKDCLDDIQIAMKQNLSGERLALDIRRCRHYLGTITGQVEVDRDILGTIFGKFCIGK